ncbi:hypothetical protein ACHAXA_002815, partial [Cyclostephanos tholiformis]
GVGGLSRRFVIAYAAGMLGLLSSTIVPSTCALAAASSSSSSNSLTVDGNYMRSPINKRSGVTLDEPERIYPISFITYLSRFLLVFDDSCQKYWYTLAGAIPPNSDKDAVERVRFSQFGQFAASVEVGLLDFEDGKEGVRRLLDSLVERYGPSFSSSSSSMSTSLGGNGYVDVVAGKVVGAADPSTLSSSTLVGNDAIPSSTTTVGSRTTTTTPPPPTTTTTITEREARKSKEALRQIALLFSLINSEYQPVDSITQLLAVDDDAIIDDVDLVDGGAGYATDAPVGVTFPDPPTLGTKFGGSIARGVAVMRRTGRILRVDLIDGGSGYATAPTVEISVGGGSAVGEGAIARAYLGRKKLKGSVDRIEIVYPGSGYGSGDGDVVVVTVSPPEGKDGVAATARATLEYEVERVNVIDGGRGYAAEKPINVVIDPPPSNPGGVAVRSAFAVSYPKGKSTSYGSFIGPNSETVVSASISNVDTSQWIMGPTSSQLLALLPSGFGLQYDDGLGRYVLSRSSSTNDWEDILAGRLEGQKFKPLNPIFGIRGRSPIERERALDVSTVVRFMASGGICSSIAHLVLTPIDVVKTKVQTKPDVYDMGIFGTFKKVLEEGGMNALFNGWEPTFVGFFLTGGVGFFLTEYFRRYYSSLITTVMSLSEVSATTVLSSWEIPLIAASAATSGFFCCFILAPFDAVRIRTVSQPDYADNILGVVSRMIGEEGLLSLFSSVPVWFVKEIPYNVFKFLVFDTATDFLYELFPAAREDIRLSLLVSLFGGTLGGMAATIASNPADVVISELKKSKTEMSAWEAVERVKDRAGGYLPAFSTGLSLRMIFISLLVSLQFFLYDSVRIALGVGSDDMKLYLNVLGAALNKSAASS